eukprot:5739088-Lingulodinium_polyedra.AAC.1
MRPSVRGVTGVNVRGGGNAYRTVAVQGQSAGRGASGGMGAGRAAGVACESRPVAPWARTTT